MKLIAKVLQLLEPQIGTKKDGTPYKKESFIVETVEMYPKKIQVYSFSNFDPQVNEIVEMFVDIASREYNGKWYTDVTVKRVVQKSEPIPVQTVHESIKVDDDLPF
jgi:hypothetical protein